MTKSEFTAQYIRLKAHFKSRVYSPEFEQLLWAEVHKLSDFEWITTVNRMIGEKRTAPILLDFKSAIWKLKQRAAIPIVKPNDNEQDINLSEFIVRAIDSGDIEALEWHTATHGADWIDQKYKEAKGLPK